MRLQGKIQRWDDGKGFGFISWHGDGTSVFVHIKAFAQKSRRPKIGDIVSYEIAKDKSGRPRAQNVRFAGQRPSKRRGAGRQRDSMIPVLFALLFLCFLFIAVFFNRISWVIVIAYFAASVVAFFVYSWDKSSARRGGWRISESSLHLVNLACGWPGALAAQRLLRHKSRKSDFLLVYWVTVFLNVSTCGYLVWSGDADLINQLIIRLWQSLA